MQKRKPIVAGQFYPGNRQSCASEIEDCLAQRAPEQDLPQIIVGGIVPHAGWTFSGSLAAMVFSAVKQKHKQVDSFVIFGAAHSFYGSGPAIYSEGVWETPLGEIAIDEQLAGAIAESGGVSIDLSAHAYEHSIEVQVPFIQYLFKSAGIVPIIVPPSQDAIKLGQAVAEAIKAEPDKKIVCIGSTDLTHYGPHYGFEPMGTGTNAMQWASQVNDKMFIDAALNLDAKGLLTTAVENQNACGPGAAAAIVAAAKGLGKTEGVLLAHTNSNKIMKEKMGSASADSVGYAAIVF